MALSTLVRNQHCSRELLWQYLDDPSPVVRKIAVSGLDKPLNEQERDVFWERLEKESEGASAACLPLDYYRMLEKMKLPNGYHGRRISIGPFVGA